MRICTDCVHSWQSQPEAQDGWTRAFQCKAFEHPVDGSDEFCHDVREWQREKTAVGYMTCVPHMPSGTTGVAEVNVPDFAACAQCCPLFEEREADAVDTEED